MENYPRAAVERAMKVQEVILRAMAKKITWWQGGRSLASKPGHQNPGTDGKFTA
jgi:hypothetical protein